MTNPLAGLRNGYWQLLSRIRALRGRQYPAWQRYLRATRVNSVVANRLGASANKKLLLITWEFPPQVTGGVYRPLSFARYAATSGWQVEIVCGPTELQPSDAGRYLANLLPPGVLVHRVAADHGPHPWPLPKIDGGILNALALYEEAATHIAPDEYGVILASGPPFLDFIAGLWLAQRTGWKLVLDYRDEWTETPFDFVATGGANRHWEMRCLERADLVIFTTVSQLAHAERQFPLLATRRSAVVHNGWEPSDFDNAPCVDRHGRTASITLAYLGNLGAMAAPDTFLDTLAEALAAHPELRVRLKLRLVGHKRPDALAKLRAFPYPDVIELIDPIPKAAACRMMREADGLLLLNPVGLARYIQGKLYEYIASGTPILVFGSGGEMNEIVASLCAGTAVDEGDSDGLARFLLGLHEHPPGNADVRNDWLASRERATLARTLYRELDALLGAPSEAR